MTARTALYSALTFQGGAAWRQALLADLGRSKAREIIDELTDDELGALMTNLGGHDIETVIDTLRAAERRRRPADLFHRLHDQGHGSAVRRPQGQPRRPDDEGADGQFQRRWASAPGHEWDLFEGLDVPEANCTRFSTRARSPRR